MQQIDDLFELAKKSESLHPDLVPHVRETRSFSMIHHPLLVALYTPQLNAIFNRQYEAKRKHVERMREDGNWSGYVSMFAKPYRAEVLATIADLVPDDQYWPLVADTWIGTENVFEVRKAWGKLLSATRGDRRSMMDEAERELFARLPDRIAIYRGEPEQDQSRPFGRSWSLSRWHAAWFARRFAQSELAGVVWRGTIAKEKAIALLRGRGEWEVIVERKHVRDLVARRPCEMPRSIGSYPLTKSTGTYHGRSHWWSVLENVEALCDRVPDADREVCRAFALLHDGWRMNDDDDPAHGLRAANQIKLIRARLGLSAERHRKLIDAVARHADGKTSRDPTIGVCWDADRLDLLRVGVEPSPKYLSTDVARRSIWAI